MYIIHFKIGSEFHKYLSSQFYQGCLCLFLKAKSLILTKVSLFICLDSWTSYAKHSMWSKNIEFLKLKFIIKIIVTSSVQDLFRHMWLDNFYPCYKKYIWFLGFEKELSCFIMVGQNKSL